MMSFMILLSSVPLLKEVKREFKEIMTLRKLQKDINEKQEEKENFSIPLDQEKVNKDGIN